MRARESRNLADLCVRALEGGDAVVVAELEDAAVLQVEHVALQPREAGDVLQEAGLVANPRQELEAGLRQPAQDLKGRDQYRVYHQVWKWVGLTQIL